MTSGRRLPRRSVSHSYVFTPQAAPSHISLWHAGVSEGLKPGHRVVPTGNGPSNGTIFATASVSSTSTKNLMVHLLHVLGRSMLAPACRESSVGKTHGAMGGQNEINACEINACFVDTARCDKSIRGRSIPNHSTVFPRGSRAASGSRGSNN